MAPDPVIYISFQNNARVFFPGLPISGHVDVSSPGGIACTGISLQLKGSANVHFTRSETKRDSDNKSHSETVHYRSSESYYIINIKLWNGQSNQALNPGNHRFPFTFMLPISTPSSFESKIGNVRHVCKATIERSFFKRNFRCVMPFSVVSICDLNTMPMAMNPILASDEKTLCCLCCASGPLSVLINIGRTGYVPGENIIINAECSNKSNRVVDYTQAKLIQKRTFRAQGKTETEEKEICSKRHGPIQGGGDHIWSGELLHIPPIAPSGLLGCDIINIEYVLEFIMSPSGVGFDLKLRAPIIIGTIPLRNLFNQFVPQTVVPVAPQMPVLPPSAPPVLVDNPPPYNELVGPSAPAPAIGFPGLNIYPNMPPPTYSECAFGLNNFEYDTSDDEEENGQRAPQQFAPQYISYNLGSNPTAPYNPTYGQTYDQAPPYPIDSTATAHLIQNF